MCYELFEENINKTNNYLVKPRKKARTQPRSLKLPRGETINENTCILNFDTTSI